MLSPETARSAPPQMATLVRLDAHGAELAASWLAQRENYQWLDFGKGRQRLSARGLRSMDRSPRHIVRLFAPIGVQEPVGLVALSERADDARIRLLWFVLGDKSRYGQGLTSCAVGQLLALVSARASTSVEAWTVEHNLAARRVLERNDFRLVDRHPRSHRIDGCQLDRLVFRLSGADAGVDTIGASSGARMEGSRA